MRDLNPYFPGDAPGAEVLGMLGALVMVPTVVIAVSCFFFMSRYPRLRQITMFALSVPALAGTLGLGLFVTEVGSRHFGEWAQLKALIADYAAQVAQRARSEDGQLSSAEYDAIQNELLTPAPTFLFRGTRAPVRLRMMMTLWPYVGVDFGEGANAVFNPMTMVCIYSD
jgi:hypothetical protein